MLARKPASQSPLVNPYTSAMITQSPKPENAKLRTTFLVSFCKPVSSCLMLCKDLPIFPNSVFKPVPHTWTIPSPPTTKVPEYKNGELSPPGRPISVVSFDSCLRTGTDSPVSKDSSTIKLLPSCRIPSAGTLSPSERMIISPRTTSRPAILLDAPSLITSALGLDMSRSASSARSVFCS